MDGERTRSLPIKLVNHDIASKFFASAYNIPWIKEPVCYLENDKIHVVYDPVNVPNTDLGVSITYIKKPNTFVKDLNKVKGESFFEPGKNASDEIKKYYTFECNDTVAEELVSLAITFALENIESSRLTAKLNMRGLEA